jgi:hypothetical protein
MVAPNLDKYGLRPVSQKTISPEDYGLRSLANQDDQSSSLVQSLKGLLPETRMPMGVNIATGLLSLMGGNPEQKSLIANLPQAMGNLNPDYQSQLGNEIGKFLPSVVAGYGEAAPAEEAGKYALDKLTPSFLGNMAGKYPSRLAVASSQGAAMNPEDRLQGAKEGAMFETGATLGSKLLKGLGDIYRDIAPNKYSQALMDNLTGGRTLEEHGKDFAKNLKNTYEDVKSNLKNKFDQFFEKDNLGNRELYPSRDITEKGGKFPVNMKSKYTRDMPDFNIEGASDEFDQSLKDFNSKPNLKNAQNLRSEMLSEMRKKEKQLKIAQVSGQAITQQVEELKRLRNLQNKLESKMQDVSGDAWDEFSNINKEWKENVVPYHSDTKLREIVKGNVTNPNKTQFNSIFKYPEEDTEKILQHLGKNSQNDVLIQALGMQPRNASANKLANRINTLLNSGFEKYVSPEMEENVLKAGKAGLGKSIPRSLIFGSGMTLNELLRHYDESK